MHLSRNISFKAFAFSLGGALVGIGVDYFKNLIFHSPKPLTLVYLTRPTAKSQRGCEFFVLPTMRVRKAASFLVSRNKRLLSADRGEEVATAATKSSQRLSARA